MATRSDDIVRPAKRTRRRAGNLANIHEPVNLTMTGKPANRTTWKVRRDDGSVEHGAEKAQIQSLSDFKRQILGIEGDEGTPPQDLRDQRARDDDADKGVDRGVNDRIDEDEDEDEIVRPARRRRTRGVARKRAMIEMVLPEGFTEDEAHAVFDHFDLGDDYRVRETDEGTYAFTRKGKKKVKRSTTVTLPNGITAIIDAGDARYRGDSPEKSGLVLHEVDIVANCFPDNASLNDWLDERELGVDLGEEERFREDLTVRYSTTPKDTDIHEIELDDGIRAKFSLGPETDMPVMVYRAIAPAAFGEYGWGHIDFVNAIADVQFSERSRQASRMLEEVLSHIIFYDFGNELTRDEKKQLIRSATSSYADYMEMLIDSLPTEAVNDDIEAIRYRKDEEKSGVTLIVRSASTGERSDSTLARRSDQVVAGGKDDTDDGETHERPRRRIRRSQRQADQLEDDSMSDDKTKSKAKAKEDENKAAANDEETRQRADTTEKDDGDEDKDKENKPEFVTKDEIGDIVGGAVKTALASVFRSDDDKEEKEEDPMVAALKAIAEGQATTNEALVKLVGRMDDVEKKVEDVETTTETREEADEKPRKRGDEGGDVFKGMMGDFHGRLPASHRS